MYYSNAQTGGHQRPLWIHFSKLDELVDRRTDPRGICLECGCENHTLYTDERVYLAICLNCGLFEAAKCLGTPLEDVIGLKWQWVGYCLSEFAGVEAFGVEASDLSELYLEEMGGSH